jgi:adenosylhomocysteine nucleosidase
VTASLSASGVLYVMAAAAEYGPALRSRIAPLMIGVGPVEAAVNLTHHLALSITEGQRPRLVVSLGSAGSDTLDQAGLYTVTSVRYRDMDASALGFEKGRTPFLDLPAELPIDCTLPGYPAARLSTGGAIVNGETYRGLEADMADMETYAVLRACHAFGVPLLALRGISDGREHLTSYDDWLRYLGVIDEKLALAVDNIETLVSACQLP